MNRQQKARVIHDLQERFSKSQASFLVGCKGLTVAQMYTLRKELRSKDSKLQVAKVRLVKRAVEGVSGVDTLTPYLKEQIGLVFVPKESAAVAKILHEFAKQNEALNLIAGCLESHFLDKQGIIRVAKLPSKEILLAQVCGTIKAPVSNFVSVLRILLLRLMWTLKQIEEKKK